MGIGDSSNDLVTTLYITHSDEFYLLGYDLAAPPRL
jgi:hypothetical protein